MNRQREILLESTQFRWIQLKEEDLRLNQLKYNKIVLNFYKFFKISFDWLVCNNDQMAIHSIPVYYTSNLLSIPSN